jgi:hypothetical protein
VFEDEAKAAESKRVEELLRVNAELAGELRNLTAERAERPRPAQIPAARAVARLVSERDSLAERLRETEADLEFTRASRDGLERQNQEFEAEIVRLRSGFAGLLRRARARLFSR